MNIFLASDHAGFELKETLIEVLNDMGHMVIDCGAYSLHEGDDYPEFISKAARAVSDAESIQVDNDDAATLVADAHNTRQETRAIVIGNSGQGEAIVANKYAHVRAAICYGGEHASEIVRLSREHNNANILSLGAHFLSDDQAVELVIMWLTTPFSGDERHTRRIHEIEKIEKREDTLYN